MKAEPENRKSRNESKDLAARVFADSFLRSRSSSDHEATAMMKAQFMSLWDGLDTDHHCQVCTPVCHMTSAVTGCFLLVKMFPHVCVTMT